MAVPAAPAGQSAPLSRPASLGRCRPPPDRPRPSRAGPGLRQLPPRPRSQRASEQDQRLISLRPKSVRRAGSQQGSGRGVPGSHLSADGPRPLVADPDDCQAPSTSRAADPGSALSDASHPTSTLARPLRHPGQSRLSPVLHRAGEAFSSLGRQLLSLPLPSNSQLQLGHPWRLHGPPAVRLREAFPSAPPHRVPGTRPTSGAQGGAGRPESADSGNS